MMGENKGMVFLFADEDKEVFDCKMIGNSKVILALVCASLDELVNKHNLVSKEELLELLENNID